MNKLFKGGKALWIILAIVSLLSALGLLYFMLQEKAKRMETEQKLSETEKAKRAVEMKLEQAQLELIQLKDQAKILASDLAQKKKNYQAALKEVEKRDAQLKDLENDLLNEKKQRTGLANTLAQLRESYDSLENELKQARLKLEEFNQDLGKFAKKTDVELKKIVVRPKKKLSGKVLVVNREFHFVVVDLGRKHGLRVDDELVVYRNNQEIGKLKVEKVYDAMSSAAILPGSQEQEISEDSMVKSF